MSHLQKHEKTLLEELRSHLAEYDADPNARRLEDSSPEFKHFVKTAREVVEQLERLDRGEVA